MGLPRRTAALPPAAWGMALCAALCLAPAPASAEPARVTVGVYLNDIQDLDLKTHSFEADLYFWFRWRDPALADPAAAAEFINPYELWGHARALEAEAPTRLPDGQFYQLLRVQGRFSRKLHLNSYPFDRQTLAIELEDARRGSAELVYALDAEPLAVNPRLELPGFTLGRPRLRVTEHAYPTAFGDTRTPRPPSFSRLTIEVPVARPAWPYSIKLLLPVLCVILCAAFMFLFHPKHVDSRVGIGITALLTIVALQITLNDDLPEVAYLILMDKIYIASYLFVIAGLAVVVRTTWMLERGKTDLAVALDRRALAALSAAYGAAIALILVLA